jgi:hypothetical protein
VKPKTAKKLTAAAITMCFIAVVFFVSSGSEGNFLGDLYQGAYTAEKSFSGTGIKIAGYTKFQWDKLFIFGPYTPVDRIHTQLGYAWKGASKTHIETSETFSLLVFVEKARVTRYFICPRYLDFEGLDRGNEFSPANAIFYVKRMKGDSKSNRLLLKPRDNVIAHESAELGPAMNFRIP